jgi:light-regulated signal transduction histidine kinase (bacteriophytochrome)
LGQATGNLLAAIEESGAVITHDPLPRVRADRAQLVQLLQNLIGNALKFRGSSAPRVHVSAKQVNGHFIFSVRDNGIGIDPAQSDRIFCIFERLHGPDTYPGTGIGLALCKRVVERHGGKIWVDSVPGHGSVFYFTLSNQNGSGDQP